MIPLAKLQQYKDGCLQSCNPGSYFFIGDLGQNVKITLGTGKKYSHSYNLYPGL